MNMTNTFTDPRDKQVYRTVEINGQTWFAENLRYKGPTKKFNDWIIEEKRFYFAPNGNRRNIKNYGCLYYWKNAIRACPEGWHLPDKKEFDNLLEYSGFDRISQFKALASLEWGGDDTLGFRALPAGQWKFSFGITANFWSVTESSNSSLYAYYLCLGNLGNGYAHVEYNYDFKSCIYSVRCIKD